MNELSTIVATSSSTPRTARVSPLVQVVLGPNEDQILPRFLPHTPRVNLLTRPKPPSVILLGIGYLAVGIVLLAMIASGLQWATGRAGAELQQVQHITKVRTLQDHRYHRLQQQIAAIDAQKSAYDFVLLGSPHWSEILDRLQGCLPEDVHLTQVKGDTSGPLLLRGTAESLQAIGRFMLNLRGSGYFYKPRLGMGDRSATSSDVVKFDLSVLVVHGEWLPPQPFSRKASP